MKEIVYTVAAVKQLRKLSAATRKRLIAKLYRYAETGAGDISSMKGEPGARLRDGEWRIVFDEGVTTISVRKVGNRKEVYR